MFDEEFKPTCIAPACYFTNTMDTAVIVQSLTLTGSHSSSDTEAFGSIPGVCVSACVHVWFSMNYRAQIRQRIKMETKTKGIFYFIEILFN